MNLVDESERLHASANESTHASSSDERSPRQESGELKVLSRCPNGSDRTRVLS